MQHQMNLLKKCIFTLPLLFLFFLGEAQQLKAFDIRRGIDPFLLGSLRTDKDTSIQLSEGGKLEYKGNTEYTYVYKTAFENPYYFGGIYFKNVLFTYVSDTLMRIQLFSVYSLVIYPDYDKRAKQEFSSLCKFLKEQWKSSGKKKIFLQSPDNSHISKGLQWNTNGKAMKVILSDDKGNAYQIYVIAVFLEISKYD